MNIVIERYNDDLRNTLFGNDRHCLCLEYFNNGIKLSIQLKPHDMYVHSEGNKIYIQIKQVASIDRYKIYNDLLFYAGSIAGYIFNNADCDNICLDLVDFCEFVTKIHLWLANN